MKKMSALFFVLMFACSLCLAAQQPYAASAKQAAPVTPMAPKMMDETKTLTGAVESVSMADAAKGTKSEIVVKDANGQIHSFSVKSTTTIYGSDWKAATLDKISKGETVKVKSSKENVALSISVIK